MASASCFACCTQRASELRKEQVFVSIAGCADSQRRHCDLSRTTTFSHHCRHLQALPAVFARTSEAQRWLQQNGSWATFEVLFEYCEFSFGKNASLRRKNNCARMRSFKSELAKLTDSLAGHATEIACSNLAAQGHLSAQLLYKYRQQSNI
jgi:hypothetical protein